MVVQKFNALKPYLYENDFNSSERWDLIEDYFLGAIPEVVKKACKKERPEMLLD